MTTERGKKLFPPFYMPPLEELLTETECLDETIRFCKEHGLTTEAEALTTYHTAILDLAGIAYKLKSDIDEILVTIRSQLPTASEGGTGHD